MRVSLLAALLAAGPVAAAPLEVSGLPATAKITPDEAPGEFWRAGRLVLDCARNESESGQLVVRGDAPVAELSLAAGELRSDDGAVLGAEAWRVYRVEWVDVNAPYEVDQPSTQPDWRPDPLPPVRPGADRFALQPGRNLIFWLTVTVPEVARPGLYRGRVVFRAGQAEVGAATVELRVRGYALPRRPILQSMIGLAVGNVHKAHGCVTDEDKERVTRLYLDEYVRARLSPFLYAPGTQAFNPLPNAAIRWTFVKGADGRPTGEAAVDFSGFDREGERYLNGRQAFSAFNIAPYLWARRQVEGRRELYLRFADAAGTVVEGNGADGAVNPVFDRLVVNVFRDITAHLAGKGWLDRAVYYVTDEPSDDDVPVLARICKLIRQADPRLPTALTYDPANRPRLAELVDAQGRSLISLWIPYCTMYREEVAAEQRGKGAEYWLYDVSATALISHTGTLNRAMFWDVWRRRAKGYLYYLSAWWGRQATPWERPNFVLPEFTYRYHHGDGYFFYPPLRTGVPDQPIGDYVVPTIRWELMREGAEDYDALAILERLTAAAEPRRPEAARGRAVLRDAEAALKAILPASGSSRIGDLTFEAAPGWAFDRQASWLHHPAGQRSDLPVVFSSTLPDGRYELVLNVYHDADYRGKPYSHFLVDGRPCATSGGLKGPVDIAGGTVEVRGGECRFTLSSTDDGYGVILYHVKLKSAGGGASDLIGLRRRVSEAIDGLQPPSRP